MSTRRRSPRLADRQSAIVVVENSQHLKVRNHSTTPQVFLLPPSPASSATSSCPAASPRSILKSPRNDRYVPALRQIFPYRVSFAVDTDEDPTIIGETSESDTDYISELDMAFVETTFMNEIVDDILTVPRFKDATDINYSSRVCVLYYSRPLKRCSVVDNASLRMNRLKSSENYGLTLISHQGHTLVEWKLHCVSIDTTADNAVIISAPGHGADKNYLVYFGSDHERAFFLDQKSRALNSM